MDFTLDPTFTKSERSHDIINENFNILTNQMDKKYISKKKKKKKGWEGNIQKIRLHRNTFGETFT